MYSHGDGDRPRERDNSSNAADKAEKKKDLLDEMGEGLDKMGSKISGFFQGKDKKWKKMEKKGGGHTLGTAAAAAAAEEEAARRRQAAAAAATSGAGSSAGAAPPRPPSAAAAAAMRAAEARASAAPRGVGGKAVAGRPASAAMVPPARARSEPASQAPGSQAYSQAVQMLRDMGFDGRAASTALDASDGDLELAVAMLSSDGGTGPAVDLSDPAAEAAAARAAAAAGSRHGGGGGRAAAPSSPPRAPSSPARAPSAGAAPAAAGFSPEAIVTAAALASSAPFSETTSLAASLGARGPEGVAALSLLAKLFGNVRDAPTEPKFRKVRLSNPKIAAALSGGDEALVLLFLGGFAPTEDAEYAEMAEAEAAEPTRRAAICEAVGAALAAATAPPPLGPVDIKARCCCAIRPLPVARCPTFPPLRRQVLVPSETPHTMPELPPDFYNITAAEAKALIAESRAQREVEETLRTREQRELEAARKRRLYRKALIRVRLPDGVVLQATFSAEATVSRVLQWVSDSLRLPLPFELSVPRAKPLGEDLGASLVQAELVPAALLNFRTAEPSACPPYLTPELMDVMQELTEEVLPQGRPAAAPTAPRPEAAGYSEPRAMPKWAPGQ